MAVIVHVADVCDVLVIIILRRIIKTQIHDDLRLPCVHLANTPSVKYSKTPNTIGSIE